MIPYVRSDLAFQNAGSDVTATDLGVELGKGPFGLHSRLTYYEEDQPNDVLRYFQIHGLIRMSFGNYVELDLGIGPVFFSGRETHSGLSVTTPLRIYPWKLKGINFEKYIGFEFRPSWGMIGDVVVDDYDIAMLFGLTYSGFRLGYRAVNSVQESLSGPYLGLSFFY
ncbi:hypothetical protein JYT92_00320 [bacterium AH-315-L15]|nr:hypothetical protein [bacterium AH-315-L15]